MGAIPTQDDFQGYTMGSLQLVPSSSTWILISCIVKRHMTRWMRCLKRKKKKAPNILLRTVVPKGRRYMTPKVTSHIVGHIFQVHSVPFHSYQWSHKLQIQLSFSGSQLSVQLFFLQSPSFSLWISDYIEITIYILKKFDS